MKLKFLGTRGYIEAKTQRHKRHSSLMVSYYGHKVMIDCGEDWLGLVDKLRPQAIFVTHAHPDHAGGLQEGAPCPVYATAESWEKINKFPIKQKKILNKRKPVQVEAIGLEAFSVVHSTRAPAVGYRVSAGRVTIFYVPDVVYIENREQALKGARLYVGDGAAITRSMVRKPKDTLIGHSPIKTQLTWCQKEGVPRAVITHCGSQIVDGDERKIGAELRKMAHQRGVAVEIAHDGMEMVLR